MTKQELETLFDKFYSDWNGKHDEVVGNGTTDKWQCFDTAVRWCMYLGLPKTIFSGLQVAWQIWYPSTTMAVNNFDFIENTPDVLPSKGDIVIWSGDYNGGSGHVGIATGEADLYSLYVFNQNDPTYSVCNTDRYSYNYILGWLRLKNITNSPINMNDTKQAVQFDQVLNELKSKGYISDNDSNHYLSGEFLTLIKKLYTDYTSNKARAGLWDQLCNKAFGSGTDSTKVTVQQLYDKIKALGGYIPQLKTKIINFIQSA
jgi:hypothetical protein